MHDVAADQAVFLLHVIGAQHLAMLDGGLEVGCKPRIALDDAVGIRLQLLAVWRL